MKPSTQDPAREPKKPEEKAQPPEAGTTGTQPPATGNANRGSPAASVMKQFAKTKAESTGRP
jgi:hypothetical protein